MKRVRFSHSDGSEFIHWFHNFGEEIWREFRDERHVEVRIEEVDRSVDSFDLSTRTLMLNQVLKRCERIRRAHLLEERVQIDVSDP